MGRNRDKDLPIIHAEPVGLEVDLPPLPKKKKRRPKVNPTTRQRVYERDGYRCVYCGNDDPDQLTIDHVQPLTARGRNHYSNMVTACSGCNHEKRDRTDVKPPPPHKRPARHGRAA